MGVEPSLAPGISTVTKKPKRQRKPPAAVGVIIVQPGKQLQKGIGLARGKVGRTPVKRLIARRGGHSGKNNPTTAHPRFCAPSDTIAE